MPENGRNDRIWTYNNLLPKQALYQVELHSDFKMVDDEGFEPPTATV